MTCLITLRHQSRQWDLELPKDIPSARLVDMLTEALQLTRPSGAEEPLRLSIEPFGALVGADQSLAGADVRDGAILVLSNTPVQNVKAVTDAIGDSPAAKWRAVQEPAAPVVAPAATPVEPAKPGYQWKKLGD